MWLDDLTEFTPGTRLLAVGWLERGHPYVRGTLGNDVFNRLMDLATDPWQPGGAIAAGRHRCDLCLFTGGPGVVSTRDRTVQIGQLNLFIPGEGVTYVAPSTVVHYMDAHEYLPPDAFQRAVLASPPMRSSAYLRALLANGCREMVQAIRSPV